MKILRHDEHFDYALKCGIIQDALLLTHEDFSIDHDRRLRIIHEDPEEHSIEALRSYYGKALESNYLKHLFDLAGVPGMKKPFILDIDLDYFKTAHSVAPEDSAVFDSLIRNASAITISRETDWVRLLNMDFDRTLNSDFFQNRVLGHIQRVLTEHSADCVHG